MYKATAFVCIAFALLQNASAIPVPHGLNTVRSIHKYGEHKDATFGGDFNFGRDIADTDTESYTYDPAVESAVVTAKSITLPTGGNLLSNLPLVGPLLNNLPVVGPLLNNLLGGSSGGGSGGGLLGGLLGGGGGGGGGLLGGLLKQQVATNSNSTPSAA